MGQLERVLASDLIQSWMTGATAVYEVQLMDPEANLTPIILDKLGVPTIHFGMRYVNSKLESTKRLNVYNAIGISLIASFGVFWIVCSCKNIKTSVWIQHFAFSSLRYTAFCLIKDVFPLPSQEWKITNVDQIIEGITCGVALYIFEIAVSCYNVFVKYKCNLAVPVKPLIDYQLLIYILFPIALSPVVISKVILKHSWPKDVEYVVRNSTMIAANLGAAFLIEKATGVKVLMSKKWMILGGLGYMVTPLALLSHYSPLVPKKQEQRT